MRGAFGRETLWLRGVTLDVSVIATSVPVFAVARFLLDSDAIAAAVSWTHARSSEFRVVETGYNVPLIAVS